MSALGTYETYQPAVTKPLSREDRKSLAAGQTDAIDHGRICSKRERPELDVVGADRWMNGVLGPWLSRSFSDKIA
jgi:hypothetical protein